MKDHVQRIAERFTTVYKMSGHPGLHNPWLNLSQLKVTRHLKIPERYMQLIYTCGLIDN